MNYNKKTIENVDVAGKKILLRCDFNVPQDKETGAITSDKRIVAALPTIRYLLEKGAAVIACSHLGKPKGEWKSKLSLKGVAERLSELLGQEVIFAADIVGEDAKAKAAALKGGEIMLLENLRFDPREEKNDASFAKELADEFMTIPEIKICNYSFGQADSDNAFASMRSNGTHIISYNLRIGSKTERRKAGLRSSTEVADDLRTRLNAKPQIKKVNVNEGGGGMGSMSSVVVEVYGFDFGTTDRIANELAQKLRDRGVKQVIVSRDAYTPEYQVDFDREKLALNGLNSTTAASYVSNRIKGSVTSYYREDGDEYDIRVRYAPEFRQSIENIEDIKIYNGYGQAVRVGDLGKVIETLTPPQIERKDRERLVKVTAVVGKGQVLSDVVKMAQESIDETEIPNEIVTTIAGDYETQREMFGDLLVLLIFIIILVYIVMAAQFENLMKPFVIMFSVPFTFTGVLIGLWCNNMALGVMAFVGILILMGIVVKNGIVLIDYTTLLEERGVEVKEATVQAARSRLRPILMTTLTTVLGMVPMAIGRGEGAEIWNSLGVTVAWGLTISTLITLVFIPSLYCSLETRAVRNKKRKAEKALTATENLR